MDVVICFVFKKLANASELVLFLCHQVDLLAGLTEVTQTTYNVTIVEGQVPIVPEPSPEIVVCYGYTGT